MFLLNLPVNHCSRAFTWFIASSAGSTSTRSTSSWITISGHRLPRLSSLTRELRQHRRQRQSMPCTECNLLTKRGLNLVPRSVTGSQWMQGWKILHVTLVSREEKVLPIHSPLRSCLANELSADASSKGSIDRRQKRWRCRAGCVETSERRIITRLLVPTTTPRLLHTLSPDTSSPPDQTSDHLLPQTLLPVIAIPSSRLLDPLPVPRSLFYSSFHHLGTSAILGSMSDLR